MKLTFTVLIYAHFEHNERYTELQTMYAQRRKDVQHDSSLRRSLLEMHEMIEHKYYTSTLVTNKSLAV